QLERDVVAAQFGHTTNRTPAFRGILLWEVAVQVVNGLLCERIQFMLGRFPAAERRLAESLLGFRVAAARLRVEQPSDFPPQRTECHAPQSLVDRPSNPRRTDRRRRIAKRQIESQLPAQWCGCLA